MSNQAIFTTSWDDGHKLDLKLLKLMNKYSIKGTFYISGNCELNKKEIKLISESQEVGAHTMNHKELNSISLKDARKEIVDSKAFVEGIIDKKVISFCYPRGKYNLKVSNLVRNAGFKYARTTRRFDFSLSKNPFLNGTSCQTIIFKADLFKFLKVTNLNPFSIRYIVDWNYFMEKMFRFVQKKGGILHLWGHSWEIDKFDQWMQLEKFFKFISTQKDIEFKTNAELIQNG